AVPWKLKPWSAPSWSWVRRWACRCPRPKPSTVALSCSTRIAPAGWHRALWLRLKRQANGGRWMNLQNRWFQLVASVIAMVMIANLQYAWTFFVKPLRAGTGWKLSDIQFAFTLFILFQTWVQPLDGWLIDRLGPRGFISAAGLLCGFGWAGLGYATSLPM